MNHFNKVCYIHFLMMMEVCILVLLVAQPMLATARHHSGDTFETVQQFNQLPLDMVEFFEEYSPQSTEIQDTQEQQSVSSSEDFHFDGLAGYQDSQFGVSSSESDIPSHPVSSVSQDTDMCRDVRCRPGQLCVRQRAGLAICIPYRFAILQHHRRPSSSSSSSSRPKSHQSLTKNKNLSFLPKISSSTVIQPSSTPLTSVPSTTTTSHPTSSTSSPPPSSTSSPHVSSINRYLSYVYDNLPDSKDNLHLIHFKNNSIKRTNNSSPSITNDLKINDCNRLQLMDMGERLYDWLGLIYTQQSRHQLNHPASNSVIANQLICGQRLDWMFNHLDGNGDRQLSVSELYDVQQEQREHCLRPLVNSCDLNQDDHLDQQEWCACFERFQPCSARQRRLRKQFSTSKSLGGRHRQNRLIGAYTPQCDSDGRFRPLQCNSGTGFCWCVDAQGQPVGSSRRRGPVNCESIAGQLKFISGNNKKTNNSNSRSHSEEDDDAESDEEEEEDSVESDEEGSGDLALSQ